jgi:hypothetical protein
MVFFDTAGNILRPTATAVRLSRRIRQRSQGLIHNREGREQLKGGLEKEMLTLLLPTEDFRLAGCAMITVACIR